VFGSQSFRRQIETARGLSEQKPAHLRRRVLDRGTTVLHGVTAEDISFVCGEALIGGDDLQ
jgi:hypothetical protein